MRRKNPNKLISVILISGAVYFLFIIAGTFIHAQNPVTNTVQVGPAKSKKTEPKIGEEVHPPGTKGGPMVYVPAGEFLMGCNETAYDQFKCRRKAKPLHSVNLDPYKICLDDQTPCHRLYLDGYYIDKYDVSVIEYEKCVSMKKCGVPKSRFHERFCNWGHSDRGNHPVNCVDWNQASAYCKWAEKRLPTEAEWEKAARGVDGRKYPWGNEFDCKKSCNMVAPCHIESTCPVGSYLEGISPYGVLDMSGNVLQWVADWYDAKYYCNSLYQNPMGPPSGSDRVMRGGSFSSIDPYLLSDYHRSQLSPADSDPNFGFRCARDAD